MFLRSMSIAMIPCITLLVATRARFLSNMQLDPFIVLILSDISESVIWVDCLVCKSNMRRPNAKLPVLNSSTTMRLSSVKHSAPNIELLSAVSSWYREIGFRLTTSSIFWEWTHFLSVTMMSCFVLSFVLSLSSRNFFSIQFIPSTGKSSSGPVMKSFFILSIFFSFLICILSRCFTVKNSLFSDELASSPYVLADLVLSISTP